MTWILLTTNSITALVAWLMWVRAEAAELDANKQWEEKIKLLELGERAARKYQRTKMLLDSTMLLLQEKPGCCYEKTLMVDMRKVYVVCEDRGIGSGPQYVIRKIFSTESRAQEYSDKMNKHGGNHVGHTWVIEYNIED